ncbi:hypothetical protein RO07_09525 [Pandoraea pulmonicola]|uniref:Transposase and inactivated derivatives n=1 Tax=Pandoraea pulmonicola TaxID=93221 RepID=A0ABM5RYU8_PANPU|nr:hypothetical protein RO07_09525 [Pandoraea pulmonicola]
MPGMMVTRAHGARRKTTMVVHVARDRRRAVAHVSAASCRATTHAIHGGRPFADNDKEFA